MAAGYYYNGLYLQHCQTLEFNWRPVYDPSNTDVIYFEYTIRVKGFLTTGANSFPGVAGFPISSAATLTSIKTLLESPRRAMFYNIGGTNMIQILPGQIDDKNGPEPLPAVVREPSSGTFMVECGCIVRSANCTPYCNSGLPVVSLRWGQTETFDQNWNSTLHTEGDLIVKSSLLRCADIYRPLCTPPLLNDYIRTESRYTLSPDGLSLKFNFTDREVDRLPPFPATTAAGSYTVIATQQSAGMVRTGIVSLELTGQKGTNRRDLMVKALAMAYSKIRSDVSILSEPNWSPIYFGEFTEDLFEPKVTIKMGSRLTNLDQNGFAGDLTNLTQQPPIMPSVGGFTEGLKSNQPGIAPPDRKRIASLFAAAFRDPCACNLANASLTSPSQPSSFEKNVTMTNTSRSAVAVVELGTQRQTSRLIRDYAPYDTYHIELQTDYQTGMIQMPATGLGPDGAVSSVVQTHGGMMQYTVTWVAGRTGSPPQLPPFQSLNPNYVGIDSRIVAKDAVPSPDGTALSYLIAGYYRYAVLNPNQHQISAASAPYLTDLVRSGASLIAQYWLNFIPGTGLGTADLRANPNVTNGINVGGQPQFPTGFQSASVPTGGNSSQQQSLTSQQNNSNTTGGGFAYPPVNP